MTYHETIEAVAKRKLTPEECATFTRDQWGMICAYIREHVPGQNKAVKLYYHKTGGGAEYLFDTFIDWAHNGKSGREGVINDETKYIVRIDGDITRDAELNIRG